MRIPTIILCALFFCAGVSIGVGVERDTNSPIIKCSKEASSWAI